jgi:hypothetical protein
MGWSCIPLTGRGSPSHALFSVSEAHPHSVRVAGRTIGGRGSRLVANRHAACAPAVVGTPEWPQWGAEGPIECRVHGSATANITHIAAGSGPWTNSGTPPANAEAGRQPRSPRDATIYVMRARRRDRYSPA